MEYAETPPPSGLHGIVRCVWQLTGHADELEGPLQPVLPDGHPELIVHSGDPFERIHLDGRVELQADLLFAGQLESQLVLRPTGRVGVIGVRFHPWGAVALMPGSQSEYTGRTPPLDEVAPALARALRGATGDAVCAVVADFADEARIDARVRSAAQTIMAQGGGVLVEDVARGVGLTVRHLQRQFRVGVGITPKRLGKIARFQRALSLIENSAPGGAARGAIQCGYADQAHFIREFRDLAGCAPGAHLLRSAELSGFFTGRRGG